MHACEFCGNTANVQNRMTPSGVYRWLCQRCWNKLTS